LVSGKQFRRYYAFAIRETGVKGNCETGVGVAARTFLVITGGKFFPLLPLPGAVTSAMLPKL
jgi:hypothetical protein